MKYPPSLPHTQTPPLKSVDFFPFCGLLWPQSDLVIETTFLYTWTSLKTARETAGMVAALSRRQTFRTIADLGRPSTVWRIWPQEDLVLPKCPKGRKNDRIKTNRNLDYRYQCWLLLAKGGKGKFLVSETYHGRRHRDWCGDKKVRSTSRAREKQRQPIDGGNEPEQRGPVTSNTFFLNEIGQIAKWCFPAGTDGET